MNNYTEYHPFYFFNEIMFPLNDSPKAGEISWHLILLKDYYVQIVPFGIYLWDNL